MTDDHDDHKPAEPRHAASDRPMTAEAEAVFGPVRFRARASATPGGLLAVAALVSGVLMSTAVVVWTARRRP